MNGVVKDWLRSVVLGEVDRLKPEELPVLPIPADPALANYCCGVLDTLLLLHCVALSEAVTSAGVAESE